MCKIRNVRYSRNVYTSSALLTAWQHFTLVYGDFMFAVNSKRYWGRYWKLSLYFCPISTKFGLTRQIFTPVSSIQPWNLTFPSGLTPVTIKFHGNSCRSKHADSFGRHNKDNIHFSRPYERAQKSSTGGYSADLNALKWLISSRQYTVLKWKIKDLQPQTGWRSIFSTSLRMLWAEDQFFHFPTECHGTEIGFFTSLRQAMGQRSVTSTMRQCIIDKQPYQTFYGVRICCAVPINRWCFAQTTVTVGQSVNSADQPTRCHWILTAFTVSTVVTIFVLQLSLVL